MTDFASLIEGIGLAALGSYMSFARPAVYRLDERVPWFRRGGGLGLLLGHGAILVGAALILTWVRDNL